MAKILIGADIAPTQSNIPEFERGDAKRLLGRGLAGMLAESDYTILNLEAPFTDRKSPIVKAGECFSAPASAAKGLKAINSYFYGLANNHILDQDEQGLFSTMKVLDDNGIAYAGAGKTPEEAAEPYIRDIEGVRIGIYLCAEHEYSIVSGAHAGANPYDPLYSFDHVRELKKQCDICMVLYHGGREHYRYPTPQLQRIFRKFAEVGADAVIAQHTHCIGCKEEYLGSLLLYGQGNFLFDDTDAETEETSLLLQIDTDGKKHKFSYIPLVKYGAVVRMAGKSQKKQILRKFEKRSSQIQKNGFIEKNFSRLALAQAKGYFAGISGGFGRILPIRIINKFTKYEWGQALYTGRNILPLDNYINCETHREIVQKACEELRQNGK